MEQSMQSVKCECRRGSGMESGSLRAVWPVKNVTAQRSLKPISPAT